MNKHLDIQVTVLTGGGDRPYALGLASALNARRIGMDFIGSNDLDAPEVRNQPNIRFLNLRGDQSNSAGAIAKVIRVLRYYFRLVGYAAQAKPRVFHLLWHNKFVLFDRFVLMLYYRLLGKRIVFTAHNVNAGVRDGNDSWLNRLSLKAQYRFSDHIFVHTEKMKKELTEEFGVAEGKATVIPFGINNTVPNTALTGPEARIRLGLGPQDKVILFFGNITPYKGLEYLVKAFSDLAQKHPDYRLVIAGNPKEPVQYWADLANEIEASLLRDRIVRRIEYVPDEQTEIFFKAADVLVLPYTHIFQSGVLFLGFSFGLPVIVSDVGSLRDDIIEGKTGFVCQPKDSGDLGRALERYFASDLYLQLQKHRQSIQDYANERYSWSKVAALTEQVYARLLDTQGSRVAAAFSQ